jgi:hypothetical protein
MLKEIHVTKGEFLRIAEDIFWRIWMLPISLAVVGVTLYAQLSLELRRK